MFYVYAHINPVNNNPFYIGKGIGDRAYSIKDRNVFWKRTYEKYGRNVIILIENLNEEQSFEIEKYYIEKYGLKINGGLLTNLTLGGAGGKTINQFNRDKHKLNCSLSKTGDKNPNYGKKTWLYNKNLSEEAKLKISESKKGKKLNPDHKEKVLKGLKIALNKSLISRTHKIKCLITGKIWNNRNECMNDLNINMHTYKQRIFRNKEIKGNHLILLK